MKRTLQIALFALGIGMSPLVNSQTIFYVDASMPDNSGTGTSWAEAKKDLQQAIELASTNDAIWVKTGTYLPTKDPLGNLTPTDVRQKTFLLKSGVKIYGGFSGIETTLNTRSPSNNITTLSGDIGTSGIATDNSYHVVLTVSDAATTILDGFTISGGYGNGTTSLTVESQTISPINGAGILCVNSSPTISNCTISKNTGYLGGGMFCNLSSAPTLTNCVIRDNGNTNSGHGAGLYNTGSSPTLNNCVISNNSTGSNGNGAGIYNASSSSPQLTNCIISNNTATNTGGGIANFTSSLPKLINCTVFGNSSASNGGGMYCNTTGGGTYTNCIFWNNTTTITTDVNREEVYSANTSATKPSFTNSIIRDATGTPLSVTNVTLTNCLTNDPLFINSTNPAGTDGIWVSADDGLRLKCNSPAVNAGTGTSPTTDIFGIARFGVIDLGAYEMIAANSALATTTTSVTMVQGTASVLYGDCESIIATVKGAAGGVSGNTTATVWVDELQSPEYVKRHYQILPSTDGQGTITLYFTQAEFNSYNTQSPTPSLLLPTGPADAAGIAHLRVEKYTGGSNNMTTGSPGTYEGASMVIDPIDNNIIWNNIAARWEVTFDATGFGGLFVKTIAVPDPAIMIGMDNFNFSLAANPAPRDFIVAVINNSTTPALSSAANPIILRFSPPLAFDITVPGISALSTTPSPGVNGTSDVSGGTPNNNGDWEFYTNSSGFIFARLKEGLSIPGNGSSVTGFTITINSNASVGNQNITPMLVATSGGQTNTSNDSYSIRFVIDL